MASAPGNAGGVSSGGAANGASNANAIVFESILKRFKDPLKKKDRDNFQMTTLEQLREAIGDIQKKQQTSRQMQNMTRLGKFIEAMEEYGKVVEIFCNSSQFVPFVWGPMKFLLQVTSTYHKAFSELLDVYQRIGENFPLLLQYQTLFPNDATMGKNLAYIYEDILEFHRKALQYFQQPMWKQLFEATWKTYRTKFSGLIENMHQHKSLIDRQATLSDIEESRKARTEINEQLAAVRESQNQAGRDTVKNWLRPASFQSDQDRYSRVRDEYPNTGKWLLAHESFKSWFDPVYAAIPPLLWLNGKPGAGKTILSSLVIQEAQNLRPRPTIAYFYFKNGDDQRNNFVAVARGILSQLLLQKENLLGYLYKEANNSPEAVLTSPKIASELLNMALKNDRSVYIILDGIDECSREERKLISSWFRKLIEDLPPTNAESIRCLFVSQDDGFARKDFAGLASISIRSQDNRADIEEYSLVWATRIKEKFEISDQIANKIATTIPNTVEGMFLLAKLICNNFYHQTSIDGLETELQPDKFPREVNTAYSRIMARIIEQASDAELQDTMLLLGWLVCAKRPLKWHEIQGAKAINLRNSSVEWDRRKLKVNPKDLCGSLVEIRDDETVDLVHLTAKYFLVEEKHVSVLTEEIKMSSLCINYLNLSGFSTQIIDQDIVSGYYAFMDYAISFWVRHLEAGLTKIEEEEELPEEELINMFSESLGCFLETHWVSPTSPLVISKRNSTKLQYFHDVPFYDDLAQAVVSTKKQLTFYGEMKKEEIALDLAEILLQVRKAFEAVISRSMDQDDRKRIEEMYGINHYKCSRFSCNYFSIGFLTREERNQHQEKHERPYRCTVVGCPTLDFGLTTQKDLDKHMKDTHGTVADQVEEFPEENELAPPKEAERPTTVPTFPRVVKAPKKKTFSCPSCFKVFSRNYNLTSHLATHDTKKPFPCRYCPTRFARQNDCRRHENSHIGEKFACRGVLADGSTWGCGKEFTRADSLRNHHKSKVGHQCMPRSFQESGPEQGLFGPGG
ncbi:hypothetical protein BGZ60DRAFT_533558 [Tricladium varicosporioides]|nr:hypothetical protein BGZ60DRAFT_533558 [Hymenoscyphus varicosporioides]